MTLIHHNQCIVFLGQIADLIHRSHITVHREHTIGDDDTEALCLCFLQTFLQFCHVGIRIAVTFGLAEAHAVNDRRVVQRIRDDGILLGEQRFEHATVGIKTGRIQYGVFGLEIVGDGSLQFLVDILRATDKAHARHTEAATVHHLLRSLNQSWVV